MNLTVIFSMFSLFFGQETDPVISAARLNNRIRNERFALLQKVDKNLIEAHEAAVNVRQFFNKFLLTGDNEFIPELRSMHEAAFEKANLLLLVIVSLKEAGFSIEEYQNKYNKIVQLLNIGEDAAMILESRQSLERTTP